jgi:hypothetical protein
MGTIPTITDQTITEQDPRVAQILALIRAKSGNVAAPETSSVSVDTTIPQQVAPPSPSIPGMPSLASQVATSPTSAPSDTQSIPQMPVTQNPQLPQAQAPNVTLAKAGPIKSFLQSLVSGLGQTAYAGTQGALQRLGIPTDYEKQQDALKIGLQQRQQNSTEALRKAQQELYGGKLEQLQSQLTPTQIPNDASKYGAFAGTTLPLSAAQAVMQKMEALANAKDIALGKNETTLKGKEIQYGPDSYLRKGVRSVDGRIQLYDKATGEKLKDMGEDSSIIAGVARANAFARARAQYTPFSTTDENGSPTVVSNMQALLSGAPKQSFTEARNLTSDMVGVKQYQDILDQKISPNLSVLNDPTQRAVIAHTLSEGKNASPGAIQALITSGLQEGALSKEGAALAAGIMQAREFGSVARKYGGNMNGTEGLMDRIISNQASPLHAEQLNRDLIQNDRAFTAKALNSITTLMSNTKRTAAKGSTNTPSDNSSPQRPSGVPANAQYITDPKTGKKGWAW